MSEDPAASSPGGRSQATAGPEGATEQHSEDGGHAGGVPFGLPSSFADSAAVTPAPAPDDVEASGVDQRFGDHWLGEGLITTLVLAGAALILFPEPLTSAFGVLLLLSGAFFALLEWLR